MTPSPLVLLHGLCTGAAALSALVGLAVLVERLGSRRAPGADEAIHRGVLRAGRRLPLGAERAARGPPGEGPGRRRRRGRGPHRGHRARRADRRARSGRAHGLARRASFLLLALALLSLDRAPVFPTGQRLAVASGFLSLLVVVAWAYGAGMPRSGPASTMAPITGILLVILSVAVTAARPGRGATGIFVQDTAGGMVARWVFPGTTLGALVVGAIALAGERAGLYGREFAIAFTTVASLSSLLGPGLVHLGAPASHRRAPPGRRGRAARDQRGARGAGAGAHAGPRRVGGAVPPARSRSPPTAS